MAVLAGFRFAPKLPSASAVEIVPVGWKGDLR
jgi:hypothetical protein